MRKNKEGKSSIHVERNTFSIPRIVILVVYQTSPSYLFFFLFVLVLNGFLFRCFSKLENCSPKLENQLEHSSFKYVSLAKLSLIAWDMRHRWARSSPNKTGQHLCLLFPPRSKRTHTRNNNKIIRLLTNIFIHKKKKSKRVCCSAFRNVVLPLLVNRMLIVFY